MSEAYASEEIQGEVGQESGAEQEAAPTDIRQYIGNPNIAFDLDDSTLNAMGAKVVEEYDIDIASREAAGYEAKVKAALSLATLTAEAKSYPWPNASNVKLPLIIQAAIQFNARSYAALVDGPNIAKGRVLGQPTDEKRQRADRVGNHMSWQLLEEMEEWEEDTDQLLLRLAVLGTLVRKTYFDPVKGRNCSLVLGPDEFVVNYRAKRDLSVCPRATHVLSFYPSEITAKRRAGLWLDVELGQAQGAENDNDAPHEFLEQHRLWDLDDDGCAEPYTITVHKETQKVVRVVARFREKGIVQNNQGEIVTVEPYRCFTKYGFIPNPDGSFYDVGFGTLLGPMSNTIDSTVNQIMDAGHLANIQGGFIGGGISIKSGNQSFRPGEWKKVEVPGGNLRENVVPLPTKEPSSVLFSLMQFLVEMTKDVTATQEILTGDSGKANAPVGTTLALIEQGLKTFTAIVKRIHRALKKELGILYELNGEYLQPEVYFTFQDQEGVSGQADYAPGDLDMVPVSDPNMATDMQRMGRAQFMLSLRGTGMDDMEINKFALETAGIPDAKRFEPKGPPPIPPEIQLKMAELKLREREVAAKETTANAGAALDGANAIKAELEAFLMAPEFQEAMAQNVLSMAKMLAGNIVSPNGPQNGPQVQQPDVPGMGEQPADQAVPPVPEGPAPGPDGGMGGGPGFGPPSPDQGPPMGGIGGPGVA